MQYPEATSQPDRLNALIWSENIKQLNNLDVQNPKVIVCFAGVSGSGKTTLAESLENDFKGVRLNSDNLRDILGHLIPDSTIIEKNSIVEAYKSYELDRIATYPNGLIILDSSIDRKYPKILDWAKGNSYKTLIISFDLPIETVKSRIVASKKNPDNYLREMDRWIKDHEEFKRHIEPDITIDAQGNTDMIFSKLKELLDEG